MKLQHIYEEDELEEEQTCRRFRQVRQEGSRTIRRFVKYYNLDVIISVGYRTGAEDSINLVLQLQSGEPSAQQAAWDMVLSICKKGEQTFGIARNSSIFAAEY